jgi:hypothetical protein
MDSPIPRKLYCLFSLASGGITDVGFAFAGPSHAPRGKLGLRLAVSRLRQLSVDADTVGNSGEQCDEKAC